MQSVLPLNATRFAPRCSPFCPSELVASSVFETAQGLCGEAWKLLLGKDTVTLKAFTLSLESQHLRLGPMKRIRAS
jgi:hypothetical protein